MRNRIDEVLNSLLTMDDVCKRLRISRATLLRVRKDPHTNFPKPVEHFLNRNLWRASDIDDWLLHRIQRTYEQQEALLDESLAVLGGKDA